MRPLTAALAVLSAVHGGRFELSGVPRMHERPIGDLTESLTALGCTIDHLGQPGYPPLRIGSGAPTPLTLLAPIRVRGDVSSQFLTALLLALPLVADAQAITIEVTGELISRPYIDITLRLLARFGIAVEEPSTNCFRIPAGSRYRSPGDLHVEADASSASYFIAAGALAAVEKPVRIEGVGLDSIQGDLRFVDAARAMGAQVEGGDNWLEIRRGAWPLQALDLDCNHIPDAAMTLAVMALYADGPSTLRNIASWRVKETDRIAAMAAEIRRLGGTCEEGADFLRVEPLHDWSAAAIHTYDDHRMAMCLSLAAFNPLAGGTRSQPVRILDPRCTAKTFPDYFEALFSIATPLVGAVPVLTVDGPTASGKGTLASELARRLGYWLLDSGSLYRATAYAAIQRGVSLDDENAVALLASNLNLRFPAAGSTLLDGVEVHDELRREDVGLAASRVAALPAVRRALHDLQASFRRLPGLVADGRDMGTVLFPHADLKVFLTASAEERASRRHKQLISKGIQANIADLLSDLQSRDARDSSRAVSPCRPAEDAVLLDNSALNVDESVDLVLGWWEDRRPFGRAR